MRGTDQLPGPPLGEWLVHVLRKANGAAVVVGPAARPELALLVQGLAVGDGPCPALVVVQVLGDDAVTAEAASAASRVIPGGLVIELGHPPVLRAWQLWRRLRAGRPLRAAAELRAQAWLGFGLYAVEQWSPVDLPRVLVTCGRRRAIPRA